MRSLRMSGIPFTEFHEAETGVDALEVLSERLVDLALVDINMPGMNGIELLERLRESKATRQLPVVVASTEGSKARLERIRQLGGAFVRKPFMPEALVDTIVRAIGGDDDE